MPSGGGGDGGEPRGGEEEVLRLGSSTSESIGHGALALSSEGSRAYTLLGRRKRGLGGEEGHGEISVGRRNSGGRRGSDSDAQRKMRVRQEHRQRGWVVHGRGAALLVARRRGHIGGGGVTPRIRMIPPASCCRDTERTAGTGGDSSRGKGRGCEGSGVGVIAQSRRAKKGSTHASENWCREGWQGATRTHDQGGREGSFSVSAAKAGR
jgi:hypothetical protein